MAAPSLSDSNLALGVAGSTANPFDQFLFGRSQTMTPYGNGQVSAWPAL